MGVHGVCAVNSAAAVIPRAHRSGACMSCRGAVVGSGDLMCIGCWSHIPKAAIACYRLVWRLVQAGLVEREAQEWLEQALAERSATARRSGAVPVTQLAHARPTAPPPPPQAARPAQATAPYTRVHGPRGNLTATLVAALPSSPESALPSAAIAKRVGHQPASTAEMLRRLAIARRIERVNDAPPTAGRASWRYWRKAA